MKHRWNRISWIREGLLASAVGVALATALSSGARAEPLPLKICDVDDRSGSAADTGIESLNGLKMVIEPLNEAGGINGRKIELIEYDGKTDPQLSATYATRCAEDDQALLIVGGSPSAPAAAMVPIANQMGIPFFILSGSSPDLTKDADYQFRLGPNTNQDAIAVADSVEKIGFKKIAIINNSVPFGINGAKSTIDALKAKGIEVLTQETYDVAATDVSPQVINIVGVDPDVVLVFPYPADGARVARTIRQLGLNVPVIMPRVGMMKAFRELAADAGNGVLIPSSVDITRPEVVKLFEDYGAKYGPLAPSASPAQGHDAGTLVVKLLNDPEVMKAIDSGDIKAARTAIRDAVKRVGNFQGLQGQAGVNYRFGEGEHHGPPDQGFFVYLQVADDGKSLVAPDMSKIKP